MKTNELRSNFLEFFKSKNHKVFPSDTLVPDDASVLFTSAGMNRFKPYFLGEKKDINRAVSCQKCLRTGDLEKVGKTAYHHTFFEMLGNFSFGDYFKKEAIELAWEFLTKVLNIKEKDLWISVYKNDEEAYSAWKSYIGIRENKIIKLGENSNFWPADAPSAGPDGPCGPCSEIFFDRGGGIGCGRKECGLDCSCGRFVEIWNLVFTQFNRTGKNKLEPLPQKNIDTGMGLERMASVLQGKESNFEIDILQPVVEFIREELEITSREPEIMSMVNTITDHLRAAAFSIADGIFPSNEERGYVVRKLIRKALGCANILGKSKPFLYKIPELYAEVMKEAYPVIDQQKENISRIILSEEEKFIYVLKAGREQLSSIVENLKAKSADTIKAKDLFSLYDTYGFPIELSKEIAQKYNLKVDEKGFFVLFKEQQDRSRKKSKFEKTIFFKEGFEIEAVKKHVTEFIGCDCYECEANIVELIDEKTKNNKLVKGRQGLVILDKTPFYPEGGGQLADKGLIKTKNSEFVVDEVFKIGEVIVHKGRVAGGEVCKEKAVALIDKERRFALMRAHTATHLLQTALRKVLGNHVTQQGSLVDEDRLRFDFTHFKALSKEELEKIEDMVNLFILKGDKVYPENISLADAKNRGALAFFKDKYKDKVRVVSIADYSKELCAGTHLDNTYQAGSFAIVSESSISSGVRRIEAVVGKGAYQLCKEARSRLVELGSFLKCVPGNIKDVIEKLLDGSKRDKEKILLLKKEKIFLIAEELSGASNIKDINGVNFLAYSFSKQEDSLDFQEADFSSSFYLLDIVRKKIGSVFIFFTGFSSGKDRFVCAATDDLIKKGFNCKRFISLFKDKLFLKGGGREALVQGVILKASGNFLEKTEDCFLKFTKEVAGER